MDRDYDYFPEDIPYEIRNMATFMMCFHLAPADFGY